MLLSHLLYGNKFSRHETSVVSQLSVAKNNFLGQPRNYNAAKKKKKKKKTLKNDLCKQKATKIHFFLGFLNLVLDSDDEDGNIFKSERRI